MSKIAIYPGTFDPFTNGHAEIVEKSLTIVDHLIIAIAADNLKTPFFSLSQRQEMIAQEIKIYNNQGRGLVSVEIFSGLLVDFARKKNALLIVRGLRALSDFEYEFQLSCMNSKLAPEINTMFLPASERTHFISSNMAKEVTRLSGDAAGIGIVSPLIQKKLLEKFAR
jgi:pantetheine-phosphate adenylyltransferase